MWHRGTFDMTAFMGYRRPDGRVGTRNYVGILSTVVCANEVADGISRQVGGTACFMHQQGCCQTPVDIRRVNDALSGLGGNPNLAAVLLVSLGCESTAVEEVASRIAASGKHVETIVIQEIGQQILDLVHRMEGRAKSVGADIRGGQPTGGNIKGGLTTIEEKSLGAIAKAGTAPVRAVYEYGVAPAVKGLVVMDSPGREPEILTGLAAAGCNVIAFTTGRGAPQGFPFVPVIKITGNRRTWEKLRDHMDVDVSAVMEGAETLPEAGKRIFEEILEVASGKLTKAEISGYTRAMDIYMVGPVI